MRGTVAKRRRRAARRMTLCGPERSLMKTKKFNGTRAQLPRDGTFSHGDQTTRGTYLRLKAERRQAEARH